VSRSPLRMRAVWHCSRVASTPLKFSSTLATACFRYRARKMVEAMGQSTPCHPKKSRCIRTEKIDFVLTQICDITACPVLIRSQPGLALPLHREDISGMWLSRVRADRHCKQANPFIGLYWRTRQNVPL
jgi:hypothetical protein